MTYILGGKLLGPRGLVFYIPTLIVCVGLCLVRAEEQQKIKVRETVDFVVFKLFLSKLYYI